MIYLMRFGSLHKIGRSWRPEQRATSLADEEERPVVVHAIHSSWPRWLERSLHSRFQAVRMYGEWFFLSPADVALLCSLERCDGPEGLPARLVPPQPALGHGESLGQRLRRFRQGQGHTVEDLAVLADVHSTTIYFTEWGRRKPHRGSIQKLAHALGCSVTDLQPPPEQPPDRPRGKKRKGDKSDG